MAKKWMVFRILTIIQLVVAISIFIYAAIELYKTLTLHLYRNDKEITIVILSIFFCVIIFDLFCLFLLQKKYACQELSILNKVVFVVLYILAIVCTLIFLFIFGYGLNQTIIDWGKFKNTKGIFLLAFLLIYASSLIYSLIYSVKLRKHIRINAVENASKVIDAIGS